MPINWKLRDLLKERGGNNASEISRIVLDQTGYQLSTQAVCDLLRHVSTKLLTAKLRVNDSDGVVATYLDLSPQPSTRCEPEVSRANSYHKRTSHTWRGIESAR